MFDYVKQPRDLTKYTLMRGVTDFGNLNQYNMYETGYSFFTIVSVPKFLEVLASESSKLFNNLAELSTYS